MRVVGLPEETYTYSRMFDEVRSVSARLRSEGVAKGDRVALIGENHPCWAVAYLAILYSQAVCVPIDPNGEIDTISNFLEDSESRIVFASAGVSQRIPEIEERIGRTLRTVVWRNGGSADSFEDWAGDRVEIPGEAPETDPSDNALLIYTSGTTGKPKGVILTHGNICAELDAIDGVLLVSEEERILSLLPLFHAYLQIAALWIASTKGCEVIYLKELTPDELSKAMIESRMTIFASVPRLWYLFHKKIFDEVRKQNAVVRGLFRFLLSTNGFLRDTVGINMGRTFFGKVHKSFGGSLRLAISAGSRFDEDVAIDFHRLGFTILQGYGLTETSGAATATFINDNRVGSVGKPVLGAEVKIDSPDANGEGEVLIKGSVVFGGYYHNPEATAEAFTKDGWFKSGDLGRFDKDGHLYITGRAKDVIVLPSGKNVHPEDLEVHYLKTPLVAELCVVGVEDEADSHKGAEKLVAVAVPDFAYLEQKKIGNAREVIRFALDDLGRGLPEYQRVRDYVIRGEPLPRTATNKIKRFELRKEISEGTAAANGFAPQKEWVFTEDDLIAVSSPAARTVIESIKKQSPDVGEIHPDMNLEIDLRLDSLSRAEIFAALEQATGTEFDAESVISATKVRDVISLLGSESEALENGARAELNWSGIINLTEDTVPDAEPILRKRPVFAAFAFVVMKIFYVFFKIVLRLKVEGREQLASIEKPYLICPNHQSYLDPFVVCSTYPYRVFKDIFHVGASQYFQGPIMSRLGSLLYVVPIDSDDQLMNAMKAGAAGLNAGKILNIYPEGERAFDGDLHPFKKGAEILSKELGLYVVPVALDGLYKVWARGSMKIRPGKVVIRFGEPMKAKREERYGEFTAELKQEISEMLADIRKK